MKPPRIQKNGTIAVLLATYNGGQYLAEQIDSLASQDHKNIDIWLSDNGSSDDTLEIARKKAVNWKKGQFRIIQRDRLRSYGRNATELLESQLAQSRDNFVSLILNQDIHADYYAFCDQDDVWENEKLSRAVTQIREVRNNKPIMYCSRTKIIDREGNIKRLSILYQKYPCFRNAIIQNIAAGNTVVVNRKAMSILRKYSASGELVSHDWWTYIVITAFGGTALYDALPSTRYRQHGANVVGENTSWGARVARLRFLLGGRFRRWNEINIRSLEAHYADMPDENKEIFDQFRLINSYGPILGLYQLYKSGIFRQTALGQISLYLGCLLGRI